MKGDRYPGTVRVKSAHGFTLVEVMIVLVIAGILATGVVFMFANPSAKVKNQAFTMLGDLNMARSEAVSKNEDVLVDFDLAAGNGYQICIDATPVGPPVVGNSDCSDETGENRIRETIFQERVEYYKPSVKPADGPETTPEAGSTVNNLIGNSGILLDDGTPITNFSMEPDGTLEDGIGKNINVVVFAPKGDPNIIDGTPYAVTISNSSGRVRISRWLMGGVGIDGWKTK